MSPVKEKKIKVLCVLHVPVIPFQGPSFRCVRQAMYLSGIGMEVLLLCLKVKKTEFKTALASYNFSGVKVIPGLPNWGEGFLRELGGMLLSWFPIWRVIKKEMPDIVHVHNPPDTIAFVTSIICWFKKVPMVYDVHDPGPELISSMNEWPKWKRRSLEKVARYLEHGVLRRTSGIVTVSETLLNLLVCTRSIIARRNFPVEVVRNSLPMSEGNWAVERERIVIGGKTKRYILYAGSLYSGFMGLESCLIAFSQVAPKDWEFFIAGDGPYKKELERFAESHSMKGLVRFLGYRPLDEMPNLIRQSHACVIPYIRTSLTELALPKKLFEFMVLGKAILYPDLQGFDEILGKDNPGRYHAGDFEDMKRVLKRLIFDESVRNVAEKMNYERFKTVSYEHEMEKLIAVYEKIIAHKY